MNEITPTPSGLSQPQGKIEFWTSADNKALNKVFGPVKTSLTPYVEGKLTHTDEPLPVPSAGTVVLVMGEEGLAGLRAAGIVPKGRTLSWLRGKPIPKGDGWYMVSYSPAFAEVDDSAPEKIQWDIQLAHRLATTGSVNPQIGKYAWTKTLKYVREYVEQQYAEQGERVDIALDLETMGLYPWYPDKEILTVQVSPAEGVSDVVDVRSLTPKEWADLVDDLRWLLTSEKVSLKGANLKFDLLWLRVKWAIQCTNFRMDTLLVGSLVNENRSNSLKTHACVYTSMGGYETEFETKYPDKGHMEKVPVQDPLLLTYAGGDTDACLRVSNVMRKELIKTPRLQQFYVKLLHPAARAFEKIEHRGVVVDQEKMAELRKELVSEIAKLESSAIMCMPRALRLKYAEDLSLGKSALLKDFLFSPHGLNLKPVMTTEKTGQPSITKEHLTHFSEHPKAGPFVKLYHEWGVSRKMLSTYVDGFMEHMRPDGRFHPTYMLFNGSVYGAGGDGGTTTGRTSAKDPAMQTLPKHKHSTIDWPKKLRACYNAPPGHVVWQTDFSQGELRVTACVANEDRMLEAFKQNLDLHAITAARVNNIEFDDFMAWSTFPKGSPELAKFKELRQHGKVGNFGLIYGMSADGLVDYAWKAYGVKLTQDKAVDMRNAFFDMYAKLPVWHAVYSDYVKTNGWVESPLGRVRHLPLIYSKDQWSRGAARRQAINSPIQSTLSDMCLWSIAILSERYPDLQIAGMTHDSIVGYAPEAEVNVWLKRIVEVMENLPFQELGWKPQLVFTTDAEAGTTLASLEKVVL